MANITSSFTHLLPTELYVAGISTNVSGSYTYNGPETFDVWIEAATGKFIQVKSEPAPEAGILSKTINAADPSQLPAAYLVSHFFHEDYQWNYVLEDEVQSNGDVYKKITNPDLRDAYELRWDFDTSKWVFDQILKLMSNDAVDEAKRRRDYVKTYADQYDFGDTINTKIDHYIAGIGTFIGNNPEHKTWKFVTLPDPVGTIPKIPVEISVELAKVSISGLSVGG